MRYLYSPLFILALTFLLLNNALCAGVTAEMRQADNRLAKPVTLSEQSIYLSELLKQLQQQTGVQVKLDNRAPASGLELLAKFDKVSVGDVIDALYSLLSCKYGEWHLIQASEHGEISYLFFQREADKNKHLVAQSLAQNALEEFVASMSRFAMMTPAERKKHRRDIQKTLGIKDVAFYAEYLDMLVSDDKGDAALWDDYRLLAALLTPEQQTQLLRGQARFEFSLDSLSPEAKSLFQAICNYIFPTTKTLPEKFSFYTSRNRLDHWNLCPLVHCTFGDKGNLSMLDTGMFSANYIEVIRAAWRLPGDHTDDPAAQKTIALIRQMEKDPPPLRTVTMPSGRQMVVMPSSLFRWRLAQLATGAALPMLALLPQSSSGESLPGIQNAKVQAVLDTFDRLRDRPLYKWRNGILLINYPAYFVEEEDTLPYEVLSIWRNCKDRLMGPKELVAFFTRLSAAQFERLKDSHPALGKARRLLPLFFLAKQHPEMLGEGLVLDEGLFRDLMTLDFLAANEDFRSGTISRLRLVGKEIVFAGKRCLETDLEGLRNDGKWMVLASYIMRQAGETLQEQE